MATSCLVSLRSPDREPEYACERLHAPFTDWPTLFRPVAGILATLSLILAACAAPADTTHSCGPNVTAASQELPDYSGEYIDGTPVDLRADYGQGLVVINVWGAWCGPCRREAADLTAAATELEAAGTQFVGVDIRDNKTAATAFETEFGIPYRSIFDEPGKLAGELDVPAPPATLYASDGHI